MKLRLALRQPIFEDVETFVFEPQEPVPWRAGQYMHYVFPHKNEDNRGEERWFTISSAPFQKNIAFTTRFTAKKGSSFKEALKAMDIGDTIQADGPKGKFIVEDFDKRYVLVAGGIGITPYHSMLLQFEHDQRMPDIDLLYANHDQNFVFGDELTVLANKYTNFHFSKFVGSHLIKKKNLKPYAADPNTTFYISGPEPMVESYAEALQQLGLPEDRIKTDFFPGY